MPAGLNLEQQSRLPNRVVTVDEGSGAMGRAVAAAVSTQADWIWFIDRSIAPSPDALRELVRRADDAVELNQPVLLVSKVVRADARLDLDTAPWPRMLARELSLLGAQHRLVALRAARYGSLLVSRTAVEQHGPPRADFAGAGDDLEWTGRILRDEPGYLVPQSVVARMAPLDVDSLEYTRNRLRILRSDVWQGQERVWFAYMLLSDVLGGIVRRPTRLPGILRALISRARAPG